MNLNMKLDVDEEQTLQYVNKVTFNIPTGTATFNLNFVNPNLGNPGYIVNQVAGVGQGMVAYQPSVAVQSYVAVPAEAESNYIHNLPVGVPVPVPIELPVPTGFIPNHGFEPGSCTLENECNSTVETLKPSCINNSENDLKISYAGKIEDKSMIDLPDQIPVQTQGYDFSGSIKPEGVIKKPCPLEMSIKAANIDVEFDKCETDTFVSPTRKVQPVFPQTLPIVKSKPGKENSKTPVLILNDVNGTVKTTKTEITWENNNDKEVIPVEDFQESLICEVEEVNDEDEEEAENELKAKQFVKPKRMVCTVEDVAGSQNKDRNSVIKSTENQKSEEINSSEESDAVPLSIALKLKKVPANKVKKTNKNDKKRREDKVTKNKIERSKSKDLMEEENVKSREWSDSDDDVLDTKRIKSEFNYEYSCKNPMTPLDLNNEDTSRKFSRVRNCCSKRECAKKISVRDQKVAYKNFFDLESDEKRNVYLMNCIEHVPKSRNSEKEKEKCGGTEDKKLFVNENIQLEIENESNGNQKLSDEIQNAIKESLKDCMANEMASVGDSPRVRLPEDEKGEKNTWNFYIVVDRCRRKVCLQFLLKLFRVPKSRVKQLQKKILSGSPVMEESVNSNQKQCELWQMAKSHLDSLPLEVCPGCEAEPRHRRLIEKCSKEDLFADFKMFYSDSTGKEPDIKFSSYKRFLHKKSEVSFSSKKEEWCTKCEDLKKQELKKQKVEKLTLQIRSSRSNVKREKEKQIRKSHDSGGDTSDDEPLLKRRNLKIILPLKAANKRNQAVPEKSNCTNSPVDKRSKNKNSKDKSRRPGSRGRDVWSLMLLHLETMPYKECKGCFSKKKHRFLDPTLTTQGLFEDYRKYFLKETNSELGLGFTMYEKYFTKNCNYTILELDPEATICPLCCETNKSKS